jgi:integrase
MDMMPRPRPPYLSREVTRHGKPVWYVRRYGKRVRIKAEYGTSDFDVQYQTAVAARQPATEDPTTAGTLGWLIECFRGTAAWQARSESTRAKWDGIYRQALKAGGNAPLSAITQKAIRAGLERRAHTPGQAQHFLNAMRALFRWATKVQLVKSDPTAGIEAPARRRDAGIRAWTEDDVAAYEGRWPMGTRQRVWLDVLLYTGLRRGDAVRLGRQHVRDGIATIKTEKTGTIVTIPILPVLAKTLAAGPCGDLSFIAGARGQPMAKASFSNDFAIACRAAGVRGSPHGVRKIAATRAANAGATVAELEAIFGWSGGKMASLYTRSADRQRLAKQAMHKLVEQKQKSIVAP